MEALKGNVLSSNDWQYFPCNFIAVKKINY